MKFMLNRTKNSSRVFLTAARKLESRWDPNYYCCMVDFSKKVKDCPFPIERLKRSLELIQYGISERASEEPIGVPMLRMVNLQDDSWDLTDLKYISMSDEAKKSYLLESGDILFNRTNSKELVGKCGVFNLPGEFVFASYLIRVRVRPGSFRPEYVTAFLSSNLGRIQIDAVSRQIAGMTNINAEEICELLIPNLDDVSQEKVVSTWQTAISKRDQTMKRVRDTLSTIDIELLHELGIPHHQMVPDTLKNRSYVTRFTSLASQRWDPLFHQNNIFDFVRPAKCGLQKLGSSVAYFLTGFAAGRSDQVIEEESGVIQIRPTNLSDDRDLIFKRNVYISASELKTRKSDLLKRGEVLFNNTNSQNLVGKTVWFNLGGDYFCSNHITRIGVKSDRLNPQYLVAILNLYQRRKVFFKLCTNWNNQSGIGTDILKRILIPLPNFSRQTKIVEKIEIIREKARSLREQARTHMEKAKSEIEGFILGKQANI